MIMMILPVIIRRCVYVCDYFPYFPSIIVRCHDFGCCQVFIFYHNQVLGALCQSDDSIKEIFKDKHSVSLFSSLHTFCFDAWRYDVWCCGRIQRRKEKMRDLAEFNGSQVWGAGASKERQCVDLRLQLVTNSLTTLSVYSDIFPASHHHDVIAAAAALFIVTCQLFYSEVSP